MTSTEIKRYGALSDMLSGVSLIRDCPEGAESTFFSDPVPGLFCGRWTPSDIAGVLDETGCLAHWHRHGYAKIWIELGDSPESHRYELEVWTEVGDASELLMQMVVWLDYLRIDRLDAVYPEFYVEHLRLQLPGRSPGNSAGLWPGQDYPSSGLLRRIFGVIKHWASALGASLVTCIPEYFHTAWLFSSFFEFIDPEMEGLFRGIVRDLHVTYDNLGVISRAFEQGDIRFRGQKWLWPTEMQGYALSHELSGRLSLPEEPGNSSAPNDFLIFTNGFVRNTPSIRNA